MEEAHSQGKGRHRPRTTAGRRNSEQNEMGERWGMKVARSERQTGISLQRVMDFGLWVKVNPETFRVRKRNDQVYVRRYKGDSDKSRKNDTKGRKDH